MSNSKIYLLGRANALQAKIILEQLSSKLILIHKEIIFLTDATDGKAAMACENLKIPLIIVNFENIFESLSLISEPESSYLICIGWDRILPSNFLCSFSKCINVHGGLLPDYRGQRPYSHVYANVENEYGVTAHFMNEKFDDGNIIIQQKLKLFIDETPEIIHRRICEIAGIIIPIAIYLVESGYEGEKQKGEARYFFRMTREEMDNIRQYNIEAIRQRSDKMVTAHKKWII